MNLTKLFEMQKVLDDRIVAEKGLQGVDLLDKKILALLTELGELANEWRGFKFWSNDQEMNTVSYKCSECGFSSKENIDCLFFEEHYEFYMIKFNPLLEEYADCLSFILSIGNEHGIKEIDQTEIDAYFKTVGEPENITEQFNSLFAITAMFFRKKPHYKQVFYEIVRLGEMLGFTTDQIEQAYFEKNEINHERQGSGY